VQDVNRHIGIKKEKRSKIEQKVITLVESSSSTSG